MRIRYRVWIVRCKTRLPEAWRDVPADAVAIEPAERGTMTARQARHYVEAFNRAVENDSQKIGAVALPVVLSYLGDPQPGKPFAGA